MVAGLLKNAAKIPRATCQLFGAIKAISNIRDSVILVHGPKGCVYHINYILGMRGDKTSNVYSTCMDEKDVILAPEINLKAQSLSWTSSLAPPLSRCSRAVLPVSLVKTLR